MSRRPNRPRFDVFFFQGQSDLLAIGTKRIGRYQGHGKPAIGPAVGRLRHKFDSRKPGQGGFVIVKYLTLFQHPVGQIPAGLPAYHFLQYLRHGVNVVTCP